MKRKREITQTLMLRKLAYQLYKQDWIETHTTANMRLFALRDYGLYKLECREIDEEPMSFEAYINEYGYNGSLYVCYREFVDCEYLDRKYIEELLHDDVLIEMYRQDVDR